MIESILISAMSLLLGGLITYVIANKVINKQKDEVLDLFEDYIRTKEGQESFYLLGMLFGKGVQQGIGLKGKMRGGKIFGVPVEWITPFVEKLMGKIGKEGEKTISEEGHSTSSGKFG